MITKKEKIKQVNNEYYVRHYKSDKPIISDLVEDRATYITPLAHLTFGLMEMLGVEKVGIKDGKEFVEFANTEHEKLIKKQLGNTYVFIMVRILFRMLKYYGIDYFERNLDNKRWKKEFIETENKLLKTLERSIKKGDEI